MRFSFKTFWLLGIAGLIAPLVLSAQEAQAQACTHYASPTGNGVGTSASSPFKIANFWPLAKPGYTLCLLDGKYTGSASMINPPQNLRGTSSARITVRALNDGKVTIDGQGTSRPVRLLDNNYFILEGFNAANSVASVIALDRSNYNIVRRVAAWDAADGNTNIFGIHGGTNNLLEDVAGWGIARKIFSASQGGDYTTIRRAWGRWEGSHVVGPKSTFEMAYNNYNMTCENCIGTWSGERMKETYTLLDYYGNAWTGNSGGTYTNYGVNQPYGIFALTAMTHDKNTRSKILGSVAYVRSSDRFAPAQAIFITKVDSVEVANTAVYIQPGYHTNKKRFGLYNLATAQATNLFATNLTGIGGSGSSYGSDWKKVFLSEGPSLSSVANAFSSTAGANLCYRYDSRSLTTKPLWPWPMNQRILEATSESKRTPMDITKVVESMLGPIPSACKGPATDIGTNLSNISTTNLPTSPLNLQVGR